MNNELLKLPLTDAELTRIAARLDNGGEVSRWEANRLLATLRREQTARANFQAQKDHACKSWLHLRNIIGRNAKYYGEVNEQWMAEAHRTICNFLGIPYKFDHLI